MAEKPFMNHMEELFHGALLETIKNVDLDEDQLDEVIGSVTKDALEVLEKRTLEALKSSAHKMLRERRSDLAGFEKRCFRRWRKAFDQFEMIVVIAEELGEHNDASLRSNAHKNQDYKFEALAQLHPRAVLAAREVFCLLKGGFPDGALARWRSLHELTVTAMFIAKHDQSIAFNYLASFPFNALRAARQLSENANRANLEPLSGEEIADLESACAALEQQIGRRLKRDYDWAHPAIAKEHIKLHDIERGVEMDHWRPHYRWASQHTHAGHRPADRLLGLVESEGPVVLVGPSNSGFVDPLHMTAISLAQITTTFLLHTINLDRLVHARIILKLADELGELAQKVERESLSEHREGDRAH